MKRKEGEPVDPLPEVSAGGPDLLDNEQHGRDRSSADRKSRGGILENGEPLSNRGGDSHVLDNTREPGSGSREEGRKASVRSDLRIDMTLWASYVHSLAQNSLVLCRAVGDDSVSASAVNQHHEDFLRHTEGH